MYMFKNSIRTFSVTFLLIFFLIFPSQAQQFWADKYENGIVVSAEEMASQIGADILEKGGNAVDAAVAVNFALAVTYPQAGNIGGGGFMMIHLANGENLALDFREEAPRDATKDLLLDSQGNYSKELARKSVLSSGVPGTVDGMLEALERYGNFPLDIVMEPAIKLAKNGYKLSYHQARVLNNYADDFRKDPSSEKYFTPAEADSFETGDLFMQKDLGKTLERISNFGRAGFYSGQTADMIVQTMEENDGIISYLDLNKYKSVWRDPITTQFGNYTLHMMPPPSSGGVVIAQIINMISDFDVKSMSFNSAQYIHLLTESMKRAFADRNYFLSDPDFNNVPSEALASSFYNKKRLQNFSWSTATPADKISHGELPAFEESYETTHFSVVDKQGNAVSVTTTLNSLFGNKIAVEGSGFLLNNEMDDFSAKPGEPNQFGLVQGKANKIAPGKRMLSSMTPTLVTENNKIRMVLGASGGPRIITSVLQNFLNMAIFNMDIKKAISAPRFHNQWLPDKLFVEKNGISVDTRQILRSKGHSIQEVSNLARNHNIFINNYGVKTAAADPRGNGSVAGY